MTKSIPFSHVQQNDVSDEELEKEHIEAVSLQKVRIRPALMKPDVQLQLVMLMGALKTIVCQFMDLSDQWQSQQCEMRYEYDVYKGEHGKELALPKKVKGLPPDEAFSSEKIGDMTARAHSFLRAQLPLLAKLTRGNCREAINIDPFLFFFRDQSLFPAPKNLIDLGRGQDLWKDDERFAEQFLCGCNPTMIEMASHTSRHKLPKEFDTIKDPFGRTVDELISQKALFWANYNILRKNEIGVYNKEHGCYTADVEFEDNSVKRLVKYFYAPFIVFYKKRDSGKLGVLGIKLTHFDNPAKNFIYNEQTCSKKPNTYLLAKMHVSCADNQMHQFYYHLARCHLVYEPIGVAVKNVFHFAKKKADILANNSEEPHCTSEHIVGRLLKPHFHDTIAINWLARHTLVAENPDVQPFTDSSFALGAAGGVKLILSKYKSWRFKKQAFPTMLKSRGFGLSAKEDGLEGYYYRDDGMALWNSLHKYVKTSLNHFYLGDDARVKKDPTLKEWCTEMRSKSRANVKGFPASFDSIEDLATAITTIIYNVSVEHGAVNNSQAQYLAYVPNRPNSLYTPMPNWNNSTDIDYYRDILATYGAWDENRGASMPLSFAIFQVSFCHLLTGAPTMSLTQLDVMKDCCAPAYEGLMEDLKKLHYKIVARNYELRDKNPSTTIYDCLDPESVAVSIEI